MSAIQSIKSFIHIIDDLSNLTKRTEKGPDISSEYLKAKYNFDMNSVQFTFKITVKRLSKISKKIRHLKEKKFYNPKIIPKDWNIAISNFDPNSNLAEIDTGLCHLNGNYYELDFSYLLDYDETEFLMTIGKTDPNLLINTFFEADCSRNPQGLNDHRYQIVVHMKRDFLQKDVLFRNVITVAKIEFEGVLAEVLPSKLKILFKSLSALYQSLEDEKDIDKKKRFLLKKFEQLTGHNPYGIYVWIERILATISSTLEKKWYKFFRIDPGECRPEPRIIKPEIARDVSMSNRDSFLRFKFTVAIRTACNIKNSAPMINYFILFDRKAAIKELKKEVSKVSKKRQEIVARKGFPGKSKPVKDKKLDYRPF